MILSKRPDLPYHKVVKWALSLLTIGLLINVVLSLWQGTDIGFYAANTVFTVLSALVVAVGFVASLAKGADWFLLLTILAVFNFVFCIQPIVMWTDEGNLCDSLSANEQQIGQDCYNAAVGASASPDGTSTSFANLITLVTNCYSSNNILTGASGVCYNIRWGQTAGGTIRAFMLISWLCQFFGTVTILVCAIVELATFGDIQCKHDKIDYLTQKAAMQFYRDTCNPENAQDFKQMCELFKQIEKLETGN
jgi:hypothetical protein